MAQRPGVHTEALGKRLLRGAIGGFIAGLVFIGITMWFSDSLGNPAEGPLELISSLLLGGDADAGIGFVVHSVLSAIYGMLFALAVPYFGNNGTVAIAGGLWGLLIYLIAFQVVARAGIERFLQGPNQPFEVVIHIVFGYILALFFYSSGRRRDEEIVDLRSPATERETVSV